MSNNQQVQKQEQKLTAKALFSQENVKQKFNELLGTRSAAFMTSVLQAVASNKDLQRADPNSIFHAAAVAATLDLPINNQLGFAYIIPYEDKNGAVTAQFQMGYKGFIQLAQRSGQFKSIYAAPIYEGQIVSENPLDGFEFDFTKKDSETVVGYAAKFRLLNGFEAVWYMTVGKLQAHALKYSQTFKSKKDWVKAKSLWNTDFDGMSQKTVIKLLLSKFAPLSIEMQQAIITDQAVVNNLEGDISFPDNEPDQPESKEDERIKLMISDCKTLSDLVALLPHVPEYLLDVYYDKHDELSHAQGA